MIKSECQHISIEPFHINFYTTSYVIIDKVLYIYILCCIGNLAFCSTVIGRVFGTWVNVFKLLIKGKHFEKFINIIIIRKVTGGDNFTILF